jgi:hypothetical protein
MDTSQGKQLFILQIIFKNNREIICGKITNCITNDVLIEKAKKRL